MKEGLMNSWWCMICIDFHAWNTEQVNIKSENAVISVNPYISMLRLNIALIVQRLTQTFPQVNQFRVW
eukprot:6482797-Amphidinium_carterae.1